MNHTVATLSYIYIEHVNLPHRGDDITKLVSKPLWIYTLKAVSPQGLNEETDMRPCV